MPPKQSRSETNALSLQLGSPGRNVAFYGQLVFSDAGIVEIDLFECVDLINAGCNVDFDLSIGNGGMAAAVFQFLNAETSANIFDDCIADFDLKRTSGFFPDIEINAAFKQFGL